MFADDIRRIAQRLEVPLPGVDAQLHMAPVYRQDPLMASVRGKSCRDAAVLALLHPTERGTALLFIERPSHLLHHASQIAFPGGRREEDEALQETALRETHEEIGLPPDRVTLVGPLTPLYVPPSRYCVHPFVGHVEALPPLVPEAGEVADIFSIPLARLTDPAVRREIPRRVREEEFVVPCFDVDGRQIWGATAMILAELVAVAREASVHA